MPIICRDLWRPLAGAARARIARNAASRAAEASWAKEADQAMSDGPGHSRMKDAMDRNLSAAPCLHDRPPHPNPPTDDSRDLVPLMIPKHAAAGAALAVEVRTLRERLVVLRA